MLRGCLSFPVRSQLTSFQQQKQHKQQQRPHRPLPVRMNPMKRLVCRWSVGLALMAAVGGAAIAVPGMHRAAMAAGEQPSASASNSQNGTQTALPAANQQVATVDQLKAQAFTALKSGKFEQSNELLARAADISKDPQLHQMAGWMKLFESQRQEFAAERHKQYDKAVGDVHKLLDNHLESYALDQAAKAALLSDNKNAFRNA